MKTLVISSFLLCIAACGVKGDPQPVNQQQKEVGMQKFQTYKNKYDDKSITRY